MFGGFLNQSRHDNTDVNIGVDNFLKFDFLECATYPTQCVWDCGQLGTWEHCTWFCPYRPSVLEVPLNPVSKRFGWFQRGENLDNAVWCAKIAEKIWERRFDALGVG